MPGDETRQKTHDESDSESEDEDVLDNIPKVDIDVTKLTPLSPEVISKQVRKLHASFCRDSNLTILSRLLLTWVRTLAEVSPGCIMKGYVRHDWTCRSRKVDGGESNIRRHDCSVQERASPKHHHQAWLRQRESA